MKRALLIAAALVIGVAAAAAAASGDDQRVSPAMHEQFQQAVKDAGLEGQNVTGRYIPGKGWEIEKAQADQQQGGAFVSFGARE